MFQAMQGAKAFWKISGGEIWKSWEHHMESPPQFEWIIID